MEGGAPDFPDLAAALDADTRARLDAQRAVVDQAVEDFKELARLMAAFRDALLDVGFSSPEALTLVLQHFQETAEREEL